MNEERNLVRVEMDAVAENEALARAVAAAYVLKLDPTAEEVTEIRTAVSEAVSNSVIHAYPQGGGKVVLEMYRLGDRKVVYVVEDTGTGIRDVPQAREPLFTTAPEEERSGMGFTVMESFMDRLEVCSAPGSGTKVTMVKVLDRFDV